MNYQNTRSRDIKPCGDYIWRVCLVDRRKSWEYNHGVTTYLASLDKGLWCVTVERGEDVYAYAMKLNLEWVTFVISIFKSNIYGSVRINSTISSTSLGLVSLSWSSKLSWMGICIQTKHVVQWHCYFPNWEMEVRCLWLAPFEKDKQHGRLGYNF